ncbi:hypothetical protein HZA57_01835 [Candidatus Poribacteria bacterium]|nr:hypothetical protein [Candidatus Poribacteria bacterium]
MVTEPAERPPLLLPGAPAPPAEPDEQFAPTGELRSSELFFRLGLLIGAGLFLAEGQGNPLTRGPIALAASLLMAALIVLTMALQWRVLGDWRRRTQQAVLIALVVVLTIPVSGVLNPALGSTALPGWFEEPLMALLGALGKIPGVSQALTIAKGLIVFLFYCVVMGALLASSSPNRHAGFTLIALAIGALGLFFHPAAETVVGLFLLGFAVRVQWERPLLIPDKLLPHLSPMQLEYLRELQRQGSLSTGETKLYLDQNAAAFSELLDYGLVEYDRMVRQVFPGGRLLHDPACEGTERVLAVFRRGIWLLAGIIYFFMPDLIPGPLDDIVVMILCGGASLNWLTSLFSTRRPRAADSTSRVPPP